MNRQVLRSVAGMFVLVAMSGVSNPLHAQLLFTENLCGPGTTWMSLPSESVIMTAEQLCQAIGSAAVSVTEYYPNGPGHYTFDCTTNACTSTGAIPEPGCTASACFCVDPGEGFEVQTTGPASTPIDGCDSFVPINIPIVAGATGSSLISVPFHTTLVTFNDLGIYFGLPSTGLQRGTVTGRNCVTGTFQPCTLGTVTCMSTPLVQGDAYQLTSPVTTTYSGTNPVACIPPSPGAAQCPIDTLLVTPGGGTNTLTWSPPGAGCGLAPTYAVARYDLSCMVHYCKHCTTCSILGVTTLTTFTDTPPAGAFGYLVSVVGGTWNSTSTSQCIDHDLMFAQGCP